MPRWADEPEPERPDPAPLTLRRAIHAGMVGYAENALPFLALNLGLLLAAVAFAVVWTFAPVLVVLAPLLALPGAALMRLAVAVARDEVVSWTMARAEMFRRPGAKLVIAAAQLVLTAVAALNVLVAPSFGGLLGAIVAAAGAYGAIMVTAYAVALWPLVCDPGRDASLASMLRLAAALVLLHPVQIAGLLALLAASVVLSVLFVAPAVMLPSVMPLIVAAYVVPAADAAPARRRG